MCGKYGLFLRTTEKYVNMIESYRVYQFSQAYLSCVAFLGKSEAQSVTKRVCFLFLKGDDEDF